jgi:hypothetical protein
MVVVEVSHRNYNTLGAILLYLESYFTENNIPHRRQLYQYEDRWKNLCTDLKTEIVAHTVYILDPRVAEYSFTWEETAITLRIENRDPHNLYKSIDNPSVFESVISLFLETEGENVDPIDRLILRSLQYISKWDHHNSSAKDLVVYHWTDDFWDKLNTVERRDIRTIYLPENQREHILADLNKFLRSDTKKLYSEFGIPYHRTYCLYGPPGTGKSSLIMSLVSECQKNIGVLSLSRKTDDLSFVRAISSVPKNTVLLLEDIDCLLGERQDKGTQITFSALLNALDGVQSKNGLIIFITTNYFVRLDPAFCRPGRIDYVLEFHYTGKSQVYQMLTKFFPSQQEDFEKFYKEIKDIRMTTCVLQKYLFARYPDKSILWKIEQLRKDAELCSFDGSPNNMYV